MPNLFELDPLNSSPLQALNSHFLDKAGVALYVKRDDLLHPLFGGNKWRKLKYNLIDAKQKHYSTILTFGGAFSNHIYATAAACEFFGFDSIGIIRGEASKPLNPTLRFAQKNNMQLHFISRQQYREKNKPHYLDQLRQQFGSPLILPEGGSNILALKGCQALVKEITINFDVICAACGTGATLAGIACGLNRKQQALGFSVLKGGEFLNLDVAHFLTMAQEAAYIKDKPLFSINTQYHFGGYAKINADLINFMQQFKTTYKLSLDAVYTAKMFYGLFELIKQKHFSRGSTIIAVHSGGLQGNLGFNLKNI